jgi:carboxymethylenebutenolidase
MCHQELTAPVTGGGGIVEEEVETPGAGRAIPGFLARPETGTAGGILIIHDVWGFNAFYHDLARRLAGEGYVTLLSDLFCRQDPLPEQTREAVQARRATWDQQLAVEDIAGALKWLKAHPSCNGQLATIGVCMGGTLVYLQAARDPLPDASIAYYGFPNPNPMPLAPLVPLTEADKVKSPLLAIWGDQDTGVGMDNVEKYRAALDAAGAKYEAVIYPGMGHAFLTFDRASPNFESAQDSWERTLHFLRKHLAA